MKQKNSKLEKIKTKEEKKKNQMEVGLAHNFNFISVKVIISVHSK